MSPFSNLDQNQQIALAAGVGLALVLAVLAVNRTPGLSSSPALPNPSETLIFRVYVLAAPKIALDATQWQKFKLVDKIVLSPNTAMFASLSPLLLALLAC
jgi:hypothetical protein